MLASVFKKSVIILLAIGFVFLGILIFFLAYFPITLSDGDLYLVLAGALVCLFLLYWIIWGELRTKALKITLENDVLTVKNFFGWGKSKQYLFSEFDGYRLSDLPGEYKDHEFLYIIKNKRKIIKLSDFYHKNYTALKKEISRKCRYLGEEKFSFTREMKEIFIR